LITEQFALVSVFISNNENMLKLMRLAKAQFFKPV